MPFETDDDFMYVGGVIPLGGLDTSIFKSWEENNRTIIETELNIIHKVAFF